VLRTEATGTIDADVVVGRARKSARPASAASPEIDMLFRARGSAAAKEALRRVKKTMSRGVLVVRNERGLARA
jgi:hypothetical protein